MRWTNTARGFATPCRAAHARAARFAAAESLASQQDLQKRRADLASAEAKVKVAEAQKNAYVANLRRLQQLASYAKVTSPFDGVVVERRVERGALVTAGTGTPLYRIARMDPARVFVQVPQTMANTLNILMRSAVVLFGRRMRP